MKMPWIHQRSWILCCFAAFICVCVVREGNAQWSLHQPPINYRATAADNPVSRLLDRLQAGELELEYEDGFGYLKSLLRAWEIPASSQSLVYSKTSLQAGRISPQNPRAIYFNDDVYVAWVRGSALLEVSTADPQLGAVFYTVRMTPGRPLIRRQNEMCLACHLLPKDQGRIPGHTVRSVMTRDSGKINLLLDAFISGHESPFAERWGGWYVTGESGGMKHMGNAFLEDEQLVAHANRNPMRLGDEYFDSSRWPVQQSDIVALMVLEHQTQMHNRLTRGAYDVRRAIHDEVDTVDDVVAASAELIVDYLLFSGEPTLEDPITPSGRFATEFSELGPRDSKGRSLRDFDLQKRLFRYPCSYLIYTPAFDGLPEVLLKEVYRQLDVALDDPKSPLDAETRAAIREILIETKPQAAAAWTSS